jgi:hypothetical protein
MLKKFLVLLLAVALMHSKGQCDSVYVYTSNNKTFEHVLKEFIEEDKIYNYIDSNSIFTIFIQQNDSLTILMLISNCNQPSSLKVKFSKIFTNETRPLKGILEFENHLFFITGQRYMNTINSNLMKKTEKTYQLVFNNNNRKLIELHSLIEDDSQCEKIWYCTFDTEFHIIDKIYNNYYKK